MIELFITLTGVVLLLLSVATLAVIVSHLRAIEERLKGIEHIELQLHILLSTFVRERELFETPEDIVLPEQKQQFSLKLGNRQIVHVERTKRDRKSEHGN